MPDNQLWRDMLILKIKEKDGIKLGEFLDTYQKDIPEEEKRNVQYVDTAILGEDYRSAFELIRQGFVFCPVHPDYRKDQLTIRGEKQSPLIADMEKLKLLFHKVSECRNKPNILWNEVFYLEHYYNKKNRRKKLAATAPLLFHFILMDRRKEVKFLMDSFLECFQSHEISRLLFPDPMEYLLKQDYKTIEFCQYGDRDGKQAEKFAVYSLNAVSAAIYGENFEILDDLLQYLQQEKEKERIRIRKEGLSPYVLDKKKTPEEYLCMLCGHDRSVSHAIASLSKEKTEEFVKKYPKLAKTVRLEDVLSESNRILLAENMEKYDRAGGQKELVCKYILDGAALENAKVLDVLCSKSFWKKKEQLVLSIPETWGIHGAKTLSIQISFYRIMCDIISVKMPQKKQKMAVEEISKIYDTIVEKETGYFQWDWIENLKTTGSYFNDWTLEEMVDCLEFPRKKLWLYVLNDKNDNMDKVKSFAVILEKLSKTGTELYMESMGEEKEFLEFFRCVIESVSSRMDFSYVWDCLKRNHLHQKMLGQITDRKTYVYSKLMKYVYQEQEEQDEYL